VLVDIKNKKNDIEPKIFLTHQITLLKSTIRRAKE